jgi:hypothetical protein
MQHISIGGASELLGVAVSTLRQWDKEGRLRASFRTSGGHRRYAVLDLNRFCGRALPDQRSLSVTLVFLATTKKLIWSASVSAWPSTVRPLAMRISLYSATSVAA